MGINCRGARAAYEGAPGEQAAEQSGERHEAAGHERADRASRHFLRIFRRIKV